MALFPGRGGAPGVYVYEDAIAAESTRVSFSTTYMLVDVPDETSVLVFPYNTPIQVNSLNEYDNLIATLDPTKYPELISYYSVRAFFQQQLNGDLRVVRVGTPVTITELAFQPANKDNGVDAPSPVVKGDLVYLKIRLNGLELGERSANGGWLGVPVEIPVNYVAGDVDNNLLISKAMRDAAASAIAANADINAGVYIREGGLGDPSCDECAYIYLTGRVFNTSVEIIPSTEKLGTQFVFASSAYLIQNVTQSDQTVFDWIQAVNTAFDNPNLDQGYLCAPAAFGIYNQADRVNLGQSMETLCSDANHKWMAMVDCGPYDVTRIMGYENFTEADPADGFEQDGLYLVENAIYKWTDAQGIDYDAANYDPANNCNSQNQLADGDRVALKDNRERSVTAADTSTDVLTINADWPAALASGELITLTVATDGGSTASAPTYTDTFTGVTNEDLVGTYYVIARDVDASLAATEIKVATSRTRAIANEAVNITGSGAAVGGIILDLKYTNAAWEFEVTVNEKTSTVIEAIDSPNSFFNTNHLPGTLQDPTQQYDFQSTVRELTNAQTAIARGGNSLHYFNAADISTADDQITLTGHGYNTGDSVWVYAIPGGSIFATSPVSAAAVNRQSFVIRVDADTIQLAGSQADAEAGTQIDITSAGTDSATVTQPDGTTAVQGIITTGNDALIVSARHNLKANDRIYFNADVEQEIGGTTSTWLTGSTSTDQTEYLVRPVDTNFFRIAAEASDFASDAFINLPVEEVTEAGFTRLATAVSTTTTVYFYRNMLAALDGDDLARLNVLRWLRGRKYQMDVTLATPAVLDQAGAAAQTGGGEDIVVDFRISNITNPTAADYTFAYCEDAEANCVTDFAGENNFYCVPADEGDFADDLSDIYIHPVLQQGTTTPVRTTLFGAYVPVEFVDTDAPAPSGLWNFRAVTSADIIGEALRGVNNGGVARVELVETGMDTHSRLFAESQMYSTTQGFLAYYAPHLKNDLDVYVPPTGFVTGLAMRRYRDEIAGFRLPPAGTKYSLAGARGAQVEITSAQQDVSNPRGLNAIRTLPGYGENTVYVWGARTRINPEDAEQALYKFVNTRVIMNVIYGTIARSLNDMIFNVIDGRAVTFNQVRTRISNTLYSQFFVTGCLFGQRAADAFDVIVDDRNNPPGNLENGLVNAQVFVVPVPTLERIEIDLIRVAIGQIRNVEASLGYGGFGYGNLNVDPNTGRTSAFAI